MRYRIEVATVEQLQEALDCDVEFVYAPINVISIESDRVIAIPPVFGGIANHSRVLAHTIGQIPQDRTVHGGFRLNITNTEAMREYEKLGLTDAILSIELSLSRAKAIKSTIEKGVIVYGKLPTMLLRRVPETDGLTDRKDKFLPLVKAENQAELLNPVPLILSDRMDEFTDFDFVVLKLTAGESVKQILSMYQNGIKPKGEFTRGLYYK